MVNTDAASKFLKEGLTFDDVLLIPAKSDILPQGGVGGHPPDPYHHPEHPPDDGGDGYRYRGPYGHCHRQGGRYRRNHKNMSIEEQADQVDRVKRSENGVIVNPFFLSPDHLVADANELMGKYKISGVPVCRDGKLVGILTNRDMRFLTDFSQRIEEVMTKENLSRRRSAPLSSRRGDPAAAPDRKASHRGRAGDAQGAHYHQRH